MITLFKVSNKSSRANHTKPYSLDYWLRQFAKNPDTKQAVNSVCVALVATGLFKTSDKPDPVTERWVNALCLVLKGKLDN